MKEHDVDSGPVSVDCLLFFLLLIPHFFRFPELTQTAFPNGLWTWLEGLVPQPTSSLPHPINLLVGSFLMLLLLAYIIVDAAGRSGGLEGDCPKNYGARRLSRVSRDRFGTVPTAIKLALILLAFTLIILIPAFHELSLRQILGVETHAHDSVIMTEEAVKMAVEGRNPYAEKFYGTPLERSGFADNRLWQRLGVKSYPALDYYVYPPFTFLIPLPLYALTTKLAGGFDLRLLLIPLYLLFIWASYKISIPSRKLTAVMFAALNPFLATFLIEGRNDILPLALMGAALLLAQRRPLSAQVFLALACLTKQYVWLTVPFFGLLLIRERQPEGFIAAAVRSTKNLWLFWAVFIGGMLPYFLWNPPAFVRGVLLNSEAHPIKGIGAYGFGTWVLYFGWVENAAGSFPFLLIQLLMTAPALLLCFKWQIRKNNAAIMLLGSALILFVFFYFSRYFHDSYVGVITALLALAYCAASSDLELNRAQGQAVSMESRGSNVAAEP